MTGVELGATAPRQPSKAAWDWANLLRAAQAAGPPLLFGLRLWAAISLSLYVAYWLELDNPSWAATSAAFVCQPTVGASLRKGWFRMIGTIVGAAVIVTLTACFPQDRLLFLLGLALWCGLCALVTTLLRNFAAYSAALAGYTAAIIASDELGATGGIHGSVIMLAISRATEISLGIVCAGIVLGGTDLGGARRRLAASIAGLAAEITRRFVDSLATAGADFTDCQTARRELLRRIIALDPVIDDAIGESSQLRWNAPVLMAAIDRLLDAMARWRSVALHLARLPARAARDESDAILSDLPPSLRPLSEEASRWLAAPNDLRRLLDTAARRMLVRRAPAPSERLLAFQTAGTMAAISQATDALAMLVDEPVQPARNRRHRHLRVADWLPAIISGVRAFTAVGLASLFWIVTAWPSGAGLITWVAIPVILFTTRADQAYAIVLRFTGGATVACVGAAIVEFVILPHFQSFVGLSAVMGAYLVPAGALMVQPWQTVFFIAMATLFTPLLAPANHMVYDIAQFLNSNLALLAGVAAAAMAFRLMPPPSADYRTRRLLALTLRDLRRLAAGPLRRSAEDWRDRMYARLAAMPDSASPEQRAWLLAALSAGAEILHLRLLGGRLGFGEALDRAFSAFADGNGRLAVERLTALDRALAQRTDARLALLQARGLILAVSELLAQHRDYFEGGVNA
jgi:uncharacterized membrane protein YccC